MIDTNKLRILSDCKGRLTRIIGEEKILELVKNGNCPHYVLTDPITQEKQFLFVSGELEEWLRNNYIEVKDGYFFEQKLTFVTFDEYKHREVDPLTVPKELSFIKDLYQLPVQNVFGPCGIYFLCKDRIIKYIGKSVDIINRVNTHYNEGKKEFTEIFFIPCAANAQDRLENALIRYYNPEYNQTSVNVKPRKKDFEIVEALQS
ncbi:MAG: hypothetical protein NXH86_04305 [Flavobacteriaceae bacterium]|nr:hypothetical protein [Flavobacteriaceae bacterium]